jgi:pimeloyl-ACP methyl ester carboxylesterase
MGGREGRVTRTVRTPDGRTLAVEDAGDPAGRPVLVHNGSPNSRRLYGPNVADAKARGLRLISYDRPGYGGSAPHPGRTVADCAADVRAICAALGIERLAMWGISAGGPHALACAALLPGLVTAVASLASPAPYDADGLDYFDGMGEINVEGIKQGHSDPEAARVKLEEDRQQFLTASVEDLAAGLKSLLSEVDAAAFTGAMADYLLHSFKDGLAPGSEGWWEDGVAEFGPWGFDLAQIRIPVLVVHGRQDRFVPFAHGQWLAAHIPGAQARLLDHDGHVTLLENRVSEVHDWLTSR